MELRFLYRAIGIILFTGSVLIACNRDQTAEFSEEKVSIETTHSGSEILKTQKINTYIEFYTSQVIPLNRALAHYFDTFGIDAIPTYPEHARIELLNFSKFNAIEDAIDAEPQIIVLDMQVKQLLIEVKALSELLFNAKNYYEKEQFINDDYAGAKSLHQNILIRTRQFSHALTVFDQVLTQENNKVVEANIHYAEESGNWIHYYRLGTLEVANNILQELGELYFSANGDTNRFEWVDLSQLKKLYASFEQYQQGLTEVMNNKNLIKEQIADQEMLIQTYTQKTTEFHESISEFLEQLEFVGDTRAPLNYSDMQEETLQHLRVLFDDMIKLYNASLSSPIS